MLRVVAVSIVIAVLGVLYILANPHDDGVKAFGWVLVIAGSAVAAVMTALWARAELGTSAKGRSKGRGKGTDKGKGAGGRRDG